MFFFSVDTPFSYSTFPPSLLTGEGRLRPVGFHLRRQTAEYLESGSGLFVFLSQPLKFITEKKNKDSNLQKLYFLREKIVLS